MRGPGAGAIRVVPVLGRSSAVALILFGALAAVSIPGACQTPAPGSGRNSAANFHAQAPSLDVNRVSPDDKIDSSLLQAQQQRSESIPAAGPISAIHADESGRVLVDIRAEVTQRLLARIGELGGSVVSSFPQYRQVRASMPLGKLQDLAALPEVNFIRPAETPIHNAVPTEPAGSLK